MSRLSIQDIARAAHVDRWQIIRTLRQQNIAEHQYMVTMIALEIAERVITNNDFTPDNRIILMDWCLRHDLPEVYMGDICTPVKLRIKAACDEDIFSKIEEEICDICHQSRLRVTGTVYEGITKLADLIDGIRFLTTEGSGKHAEFALNKIKGMYKERLYHLSKEYTKYRWTEVSKILTTMLYDECGFIGFEGPIK